MEGRVLLLPLFKQATGCNHNPDNNGFTIEGRKNEDNLYMEIKEGRSWNLKLLKVTCYLLLNSIGKIRFKK